MCCSSVLSYCADCCSDCRTNVQRVCSWYASVFEECAVVLLGCCVVVLFIVQGIKCSVVRCRVVDGCIVDLRVAVVCEASLTKPVGSSGDSSELRAEMAGFSAAAEIMT
jgi:hypothetical protein